MADVIPNGAPDPERERRSAELIVLLNAMIQTLGPVRYNELNHIMPAVDEGGPLLEIERVQPKLGIKEIPRIEHWAVTTMSLIATITDVLVDKRLAAMINDDGIIIGFTWMQTDA